MAGRVYDYGRFRGTASRLIGKFGAVAELRQGDARYPTTVVLSDYRGSAYADTNIARGDFMGLVPAAGLPVAPLPGSRLFWEGKERTIISVTQTKPGPTPVMYTLQLRGAR